METTESQKRGSTFAEITLVSHIRALVDLNWGNYNFTTENVIVAIIIVRI